MVRLVPACVRDLPGSVVRALAAPAPRARGGERPAAGRRRRGGGGGVTPLGGGVAGAGPGWSPPRRRRWAAGHRAKLRPEGVFPSGQALRERDATAKWRPRAHSSAQRNGGSAGCPDEVAQGVRGAHARGSGRGHVPWPGPPLSVSRWRSASGAQFRVSLWPASPGLPQPVESAQVGLGPTRQAPRRSLSPRSVPSPQSPTAPRCPTVDQALSRSPADAQGGS